MDERLLRLYERELEFLREGAGEFARIYPKVASHLNLDSRHDPDPGVERLLEGLGFLTARIQLQMESEFPHFTRNLLERVQPHSLAPLPSMAVVQLTPDLHQGSLVKGFSLAADSALSAFADVEGQSARCEWRSLQPVTLWPLQIESAEYLPSANLLSGVPAGLAVEAHSAIRLRLKTTAGTLFNQLALEHLCLYLGRPGAPTLAVHEALLSRTLGIIARPSGSDDDGCEVIEPWHISQVDMEPGQDAQLKPRAGDGADAFALLRRFLAFPESQRFIRLCGLGPAVRRCGTDSLELVFLLAPLSNPLPADLDPSFFSLFCVPVQNLFKKRTNRINLQQHRTDIDVVVDQANPLHHEIHQVLQVQGYFRGGREHQRFVPLYSPLAGQAEARGTGFFQSQRRPSRPMATGFNGQPPYAGCDLSITLVDPEHPPYRPDLHQLAADVICSNRHLVQHIRFGKGNTDFVLEVSAPVISIRRLAGPSAPLSLPVSGAGPWSAIQHLSRNFLPLADADGQAGAAALREMLSLYIASDDAVLQRLLQSILSLRASVLTRRLPGPGPVVFGRGLQFELTLDDAACEGIGAFVFGGVLEGFFARYAAINSFTCTVLYTRGRGLIHRWPVRGGQCMVL